MIAYSLCSAVIPVWAWLLTAISRQPRNTRRMRHARSWSTPRPWRQLHRGTRVRPRGRHETRLTPAEVIA